MWSWSRALSTAPIECPGMHVVLLGMDLVPPPMGHSWGVAPNIRGSGRHVVLLGMGVVPLPMER